MFGRIAKRYDLMNQLMTAGQDTRWRREVIRKAQLPSKGSLLDLGAGTGDLAREALRQVAWLLCNCSRFHPGNDAGWQIPHPQPGIKMGGGKCFVLTISR
jgi:hypothetical protein